jgi:hypothetical protein
VGYDQDAWAVTLDYHAQAVEPAFALIDAVHACTAALLRRLDPSVYARSGHHTESGPYTAEEWLRYNAEHMHAHAAQIERNVAAFGSRG